MHVTWPTKEHLISVERGDFILALHFCLSNGGCGTLLFHDDLLYKRH